MLPIGIACAVLQLVAAAWVVNGGGGTVSRIDPATNRVVATIRVHAMPTGITFGRGRIWVASIAGAGVQAIDPATNRVVGAVSGIAGPRDVAVVGRDLWVASFDASELVRVRLR